jgi:hypothetical protein
MKKIMALLICAVLTLGAFSGCITRVTGGQTGAETAETKNGKTDEPASSGAETAETKNGKTDETKKTDVKVTDAVSYTKKPVCVVPGYTDADINWTHEIHIPAVSGDSSAVQAFNARIDGKYHKYVTTLQNNEEDSELYGVAYHACVKDGVVGILIVFSQARQFAGVGTAYEAYYFNANEDRELGTAEAYLSAIGTDLNGLDQKIRATKAFKDFADEYEQYNVPFRGEIKYGVADDKAFTAVYSNPDGPMTDEVLIVGTW